VPLVGVDSRMDHACGDDLRVRRRDSTLSLGRINQSEAREWVGDFSSICLNIVSGCTPTLAQASLGMCLQRGRFS